MKRIAIACAGQQGDIITALSVLYSKDELWGPDAEITWLADERYYDIFKFNPYLKVKQFPHGWQISEQDKQTIYAERIAKDAAEGKPGWEDLSHAMNVDNTLIQEAKHNFPSIAMFDEVYFPAPHQQTVEKRAGINYPNVSKKVFGVPNHYQWHPVLFWSDEEREMVKEFMTFHNPNRKKILFETFAGSGQTKLTHDMVINTMRNCEELWGEDCIFIFLSHKYLTEKPEFPPDFFDMYNAVSAARFTVRQCALLANHADFLVSVSSGVTCALSCWRNKPIPAIQFCGSAICGTKELWSGEMIQVFSDGNPNAEEDYYTQLNFLLTKYK